jgi:hypothetical protein
MNDTASSSSTRSDQAGPLRDEGGLPIVPPKMVRTLRVVAEAIFVTDAGPPPKERLDWLADECEDFLARSGARTLWVLRLALFALGVLAPLAILRFTSLAKLPLSERTRALGRLEDGPLGAPVVAIKAFLCVIYYEHPDAARQIGFDGQCLMPVNRPEIGS